MSSTTERGTGAASEASLAELIKQLSEQSSRLARQGSSWPGRACLQGQAGRHRRRHVRRGGAFVFYSDWAR